MKLHYLLLVAVLLIAALPDVSAANWDGTISIIHPINSSYYSNSHLVNISLGSGYDDLLSIVFFNGTGNVSYYNVAKNYSVQSHLAGGTPDRSTTTEKTGMKIFANKNFTIYNLTLYYIDNATTCYVTDSGKNTIQSGTVNAVTKVCPLASPVEINKSSTYYLLADKDGAVRNYTFVSNTSFPFYNGLFNWTASVPEGGSDSTSYAVTITNVTLADGTTAGTPTPANFTFKDGFITMRAYANTSTSTNMSAPLQFTVDTTTLRICNATYPTPFLNLSFKDEVSGAVKNATISSAAFTYQVYASKTYSFSNSTHNSNYTFCAIPATAIIPTNLTVTYTSTDFGTYPQRTAKFSDLSLTNATIDKTLYLLDSSDGQYVTFQVVTSSLQNINGATITATRSIGGVNTTVAYGTTDASGTVAFWLNPLESHTITVSKTGYTSYSEELTPSQTSYTITLSQTGGANITDYYTGLSYAILPLNSTLLKDYGSYIFNFTISHTTYSFTEFGLQIINSSGDVVNDTSSSDAGGGILNLRFNAENDTMITAKANWTIEGEHFYITKYYLVLDDNMTGMNYSIAYMFNDLNAYLNDGMFGLTAFGKTLLIFMLIFIVTGVACYNFGLYSPTAIAGIVFGQVALFDVGLGLITNPVGAIAHFPTIFIGIIFVALLIKEASSSS